MKLWGAAAIIAAGVAIDLATKTWARASPIPYGVPLDFSSLCVAAAMLSTGDVFVCSATR